MCFSQVRRRGDELHDGEVAPLIISARLRLGTPQTAAAPEAGGQAAAPTAAAGGAGGVEIRELAGNVFRVAITLADPNDDSATLAAHLCLADADERYGLDGALWKAVTHCAPRAAGEARRAIKCTRRTVEAVMGKLERNELVRHAARLAPHSCDESTRRQLVTWGPPEATLSH